jgi:beta-mannosidase
MPVDFYKERVRYFNSEYGMQSLMPMSSLKLFLSEEELSEENHPSMVYHNKMRQGSEIVASYTRQLFKNWTNNNVEDYSYLTICMQAYGVGIRLDSIRRDVPRSMGSLYWQFNDVWPVFSWSSIDFFGQWKALHYTAKHYYQNVVVSIKLIEEQK